VRFKRKLSAIHVDFVKPNNQLAVRKTQYIATGRRGEEIRNVYKILAGKPERKGQLGRIFFYGEKLLAPRSTPN
jgi:hypothetical protein